MASTPSATNTPAHNVPRPPQAGSQASVYHGTKDSPIEELGESKSATSSNSDSKATANAPSTPTRSVPRPPQTNGRPAVTDSVYDRSAQSAAHVQTTSRSGSVMDRAAEPGEHTTPRPTQPKPLYQPQAPHDDQKPAAKPATHTQTSHSEPKEHSR